MAEIVRRRSRGGVLPLGLHASISGPNSVHCASVSIYLLHQEEQNACSPKRFKSEQALETVKSHLQSPTDESLLRCPVYLVTFALERFCCSVAEARTYDLRPLQAWVRQRMEGLSYLGMVDVAFYSNISVDTGVYPIPEGDEAEKVRPLERDRRQTVSWHVHLFVWGVPRAQLKALVDEVNATLAHGVPKNPSLVPGLRAADYREVKPKYFEGKVLYILKSPREYRVWDEKEELIDWETGEIMVELTGRFRQKSRRLRRGDGVRIFRVMQDRYLDWMMLGGGAGRDLLLSIRKEALKPLQAHERRQHPKPARGIRTARWAACQSIPDRHAR